MPWHQSVTLLYITVWCCYTLPCDVAIHYRVTFLNIKLWYCYTWQWAVSKHRSATMSDITMWRFHAWQCQFSRLYSLTFHDITVCLRDINVPLCWTSQCANVRAYSVMMLIVIVWWIQASQCDIEKWINFKTKHHTVILLSMRVWWIQT
jgi:hypothetical protein